MRNLLIWRAAWIDALEEGEEVVVDIRITDELLSPLCPAHSAQHHYATAPPPRRVSQDGFVDPYDDASHGMSEKRTETGLFGVHREPVRGRKWDHARKGDPVILQCGVLPNPSPWLAYIKSSMYGADLPEAGRRVDEDFLQQQTPGYQKPWRGDLKANADADLLSGLLHSKKQRRSLIKRLQVRTPEYSLAKATLIFPA
jgi:hypothetical protein